MITLLRDEGLLSEERIGLLLSWRHSGFSVHNTVRLAVGDAAGIDLNRAGEWAARFGPDTAESEPRVGYLVGMT